MSIYKAINPQTAKSTARRVKTFGRPAIMAIVAMVLFGFALQGCSMFKKKDDSTLDIEVDDTGDTGDATPPPSATIQVSYKLKGDGLETATVIKFFSAEVIQTIPHDAQHQESLVRFDGGVPVWEFKAQRSTLGSLTGVGGAHYALKAIQYGKLPDNYTQVIPDEGPPEPLDRGSFYVFEISRNSGVISYQAVKVEGDGSLVAYNAQPRAGNSFLLCCNLAQEFTEPVTLPDASQTVEQAADQVDQNNQVDPNEQIPQPPPEAAPAEGASAGPDSGGGLPEAPSGPVNLLGGGGGGGLGGMMMNPSNTPRGDPATMQSP
jgi:hypothetical protein